MRKQYMEVILRLFCLLIRKGTFTRVAIAVEALVALAGVFSIEIHTSRILVASMAHTAVVHTCVKQKTQKH